MSKKDEILKLVKEYYKETFIKDEYKEGDRINYSGRVFDEEEMLNLIDSSLEFWLTNGRYTKEFETEFGKHIGCKYVSLVNSGSSANLIAFMSLTSPLLKSRRIKRKDEVITVSAGFPTTISPILDYGAVPVFVDVTIPGYNIDVNELEKALSKKTKAVMIAHTLGNPFNIKAVKEFCDKYKLWLIEDNCDALGSMYNLDGDYKYTGSFGDIATSSFYPPHHITTGEGGAVYTNNPKLHKIIRSFRDWGRDCMCESGQDNKCGHRFDKQYGELPFGYDHKYVYSHFGYNLKATDLQASIGCAQLKKLDSFTHKRIDNYNLLMNELLKYKVDSELILPVNEKNSIPSPFGFMITCKKENIRNKIVKYLENKNIQTRMLFSGNITKQPCFDSIRNKKGYYRVIGELKNTDKIMNDSFWIGVYPGMNEKMIKYMAKCISEAIRG